MPEAGNPILSGVTDLRGIQVTMAVMKLFLKVTANLRPIGLGLAVFSVLAFATGCGNTSPDPQASPEATIAAPSLDPEPTLSPNEIQPDAERDFRAALVKSQEGATKSGLTELWFDTDGVMVQVAVQDSKSSTCATYDVEADSVFEIDETSMMPARTIAELDGLVSGGNDEGSVTSNAPDEFTITNTIDLSKYVTIYTLDAEGRIAKSVISSDDEPLGEITYTYSVTKEGKAALVALSTTD